MGIMILVQEDGDGITSDDSKAVKDGEQEDSGTSSREPGIDHFNNEETDPVKTNAMSKFLLQILLQTFMINVNDFLIKKNVNDFLPPTSKPPAPP